MTSQGIEDLTFKRIALSGALIVSAIALAGLGILFYQGAHSPDTAGKYVALGSSFAAGLGLGPRDPGSPHVCMRSTGGYPQQLARRAGLKLVDMSCSGSTTGHIWHGGQVFLGPQLAAVGPNARLVTITSGGNDTGYIGDLALSAGRTGVLGRLFWNGPAPLEQRDFAQVTENFRQIVATVKRRAPKATVVLVSYPPVVPGQGTCAALGVDRAMTDLALQIADRLHEATRLAAEQSGAMFVDMAAIGAGHDACSAEPWVNGASPESGAPFHPTPAGAKATADAIYQAVYGEPDPSAK